MRVLAVTYGVLLWALLSGCSEMNEAPKDTPVSGSIKISADESYLPITKAEVDVFQSLYEKAHLDVTYQTQDTAVMDLLNGKAEMIFVGRPLNPQETGFLKQKNISVKVNKIAIDAVALLVHGSFKDSLLTTSQLKDIFSGKAKRWKDLSPSYPDAEIYVVVDLITSSNLRYLAEKFSIQPGTVKIIPAGSNQKVLEFVRQTPGSLGVIGSSWISDEDDRLLGEKLDQIKVLAIGEGNERDRGKFYQPLQAHLTDSLYPLTRPVYIVNKNTKTGLGSGFASFILSDIGQRIILKEGLLPAVMPGRHITVTQQ